MLARIIVFCVILAIVYSSPVGGQRGGWWAPEGATGAFGAQGPVLPPSGTYSSGGGMASGSGGHRWG
ncbi:hypothetical protein HNY73_009196 [Argiope bruennichi]|uniref:Uncharacterized protein n=1 Tax=Argiope bruennichi TaxID=94029 RepID=A0A8T0F8T1_ARGBR|nr:hypothetical protein HNY73_009196 [Argiope bruennichi]